MKKLVNETIIIKSIEQFNNLKEEYNREQRVITICKCGYTKESSLRFAKFPFICKNCEGGSNYFNLSNILLTTHGQLTSDNKVQVPCAECDNIDILEKDPFHRVINRYGKYLCFACRKKLNLSTRKSNKGVKLSDEERLKRNAIWEKTLIEKYGSKDNYREHLSQKCKEYYDSLSDEEKDLIQKNKENGMISKYGVKNPMLIEEFKNKVLAQVDYKSNRIQFEKTVIEKYGSLENYYKYNAEKVKQSNLEKFGVEYNWQREDVKEKIKQTCLEKYGVENGGGSEESLRKIKNTFQTKYGVDNAFQLESVKEQSKKTCLERYGKEYYTQTEEYILRAHKRYNYNNILFDSSWELAFYIYCIDHNLNISKCTKQFSYITSDNKSHIYTPDFIVNGIIYEIKGSQLFNEDGELGILGRENDLEKYKIIKANNIILITNRNISKYLSYIYDTYGKNFLASYRCK